MDMRKIIQYIPALALFLIGGGLQVSGIMIPWLGYCLMGLGVLLLLIPGWSLIKRIFQAVRQICSNVRRLRLTLQPVQEYKDIATRFQLVANPNGIEFYPDRSKLPRIKDEFANISEGSVLWYTGYEASNILYLLKDKIRRLMLVNPKLHLENDDAKRFAKRIWQKDPQFVHDMVETFAKDAARAGIAVRLLNEIPTILMVVSSPHTESSWIRVEKCDLSRNATDWSSVRIYKKPQALLYESLYYLYEAMWDKSQPLVSHKEDSPT